MKGPYAGLESLDSTIGRINTHPEYSQHVRQGAINLLQVQSTTHSLLIEASGEEEATGRPTRNINVRVSEERERLEDTWDYLGREGINALSLARLGWHIEPKKNLGGGLRLRSYQFGGFAPPEPHQLEPQLQELAYRLNHSSLHPVIRAADAHISTVQIHPYADGNGRAARLLQNFCLQQRGYPAAVIGVDERDQYIRLMAGVLGDRYQGRSIAEDPSPQERAFTEFIITKVHASVDQLEAELRNARSYDVLLQNVRDPKNSRHVANLLRKLNNNPNVSGVTVSQRQATGRKNLMLRVRGNVGGEDITAVLEHCKYKPFGSYRITSLTDCVEPDPQSLNKR